MKLTAAIIAAAGLATLASAQGPVISNNGTITCLIANGTYCAGSGSNIIIRCTNSVGHAGNCNDNLAGEPPVGVNFAPCFDCGADSGRAACSKNGIVYPGSGTGLGSNSFSANDTSICSLSTGAPYPNGTNPGGPIVNATSTGTGGASPTGGYGSGSSPSSGAPIPYTGAASSTQMMGAGAVVGFGAVLAALGMM